mmetsp:Transcript_17306/g.39076  ORF Transcript_17306/g.39076 Transcript_17306/m.39076 type:complete len:214 (-) Transcript_17306:1847-2488(-)
MKHALHRQQVQCFPLGRSLGKKKVVMVRSRWPLLWQILGGIPVIEMREEVGAEDGLGRRVVMMKILEKTINYTTRTVTIAAYTIIRKPVMIYGIRNVIMMNPIKNIHPRKRDMELVHRLLRRKLLKKIHHGHILLLKLQRKWTSIQVQNMILICVWAAVVRKVPIHLRLVHRVVICRPHHLIRGLKTNQILKERMARKKKFTKMTKKQQRKYY